jgi:type IV pilus assembly protein PilQ
MDVSAEGIHQAHRGLTGNVVHRESSGTSARESTTIIDPQSVRLRPLPVHSDAQPLSHETVDRRSPRLAAPVTRSPVEFKLHDVQSVPSDSRKSSSRRGALSVAAGEVSAASNPSLADRIRLVSEEQSVLVPIKTTPIDKKVDLKGEQGLVTLIATDADLKSVLRMIADHHGMNLVLAPDVQGPVTVSIRGARLEEVLDAILGVAGFSWHRVDNLLYVTAANAVGMDPRVQGRSVRVYQLDYVAAADIQQVATGLLSPVGNAFISESDPADEMKTRETLVVEDTPSAQRRIAEYIAQVDVAPMQVLIEAHVLQIALDEEEKHGVDLEALLRTDGSAVTLDGFNFTDLSGPESDFAIRIDGTDLNGVIELIRRCTNSRTLASPKVSVVNRQEAKIQIGQRLPYSVATTTQTTTVQSVEFLDVGIVLTVRPVITDDGNVLMYVLPKVSGGKITQNGFPEEETTEVQTTILIPDGGGIVIGGLIREDSVQSRAVVPYFHKVPVVGNLFKRRSDEARRNELIVALVAHVIHHGHGPRMKEVMDLETALPDYAAGELTQR